MILQLDDREETAINKSFLLTYGWSSDLSLDDFFSFGEKFGDGTDEDHFQIGFTSLSMIQSLSLGKIFH